MLDLVDEAFDEVALFIELFVIWRRIAARGKGRDHRVYTEREISPDSVGIVCLICDDVLGHEAVDQGLGLCAVVSLAGRKDEAQRVAEGVDGDMDFRGRAAARAADGLSFGPPFPPAACWCARMIVASMMTLSRSGSSLT